MITYNLSAKQIFTIKWGGHDNDSVTLNELTPKLVNILTRYLQIRFGASIEDAEDCVQTVLLRGVKRIKENGIENQNLFWRISLARHWHRRH